MSESDASARWLRGGRLEESDEGWRGLAIAAVVVGGTALVLATGGGGAVLMADYMVDTASIAELDTMLAGGETLGEVGEMATQLYEYGEGLGDAANVLSNVSTGLGAVSTLGTCLDRDWANCAAGAALTALGAPGPLPGVITSLAGFADFNKLKCHKRGGR